MKEFTTAFEALQSETEADGVKPIEFKLDGQTIKSYPPTDGQLAFMMASMGRGQTSDGRFAAIVNILLESFDDEGREYVETRLLTRDDSRRLPVSQVNDIFEFLIEEWFGRPTEPQSGSAGSPPSDTPKSKPRTTKSNSSD